MGYDMGPIWPMRSGGYELRGYGGHWPHGLMTTAIGYG